MYVSATAISHTHDRCGQLQSCLRGCLSSWPCCWCGCLLRCFGLPCSSRSCLLHCGSGRLCCCSNCCCSGRSSCNSSRTSTTIVSSCCFNWHQLFVFFQLFGCRWRQDGSAVTCSRLLAGQRGSVSAAPAPVHQNRVERFHEQGPERLLRTTGAVTTPSAAPNFDVRPTHCTDTCTRLGLGVSTRRFSNSSWGGGGRRAAGRLLQALRRTHTHTHTHTQYLHTSRPLAINNHLRRTSKKAEQRPPPAP
jgi:hypothetical protein